MELGLLIMIVAVYWLVVKLPTKLRTTANKMKDLKAQAREDGIKKGGIPPMADKTYILNKDDRGESERIYLYAMSRSQPEPYEVVFEFDDDSLMIYCSCPAGENNMHCRHRISLIQNQSQALANPHDLEQLKALQKAQEWVNRTTCRQEIQRLRELEDVGNELKACKARLDEHFEMGFPLLKP